MSLKTVLFTAKWCQPCRQVKPIIDELVSEYGLDFEMVDVDEDGTLAVKYGVMSVPCVVLLKDGEVVDMVHGVKPRRFFQGIIERLGGRPSLGHERHGTR